MSGKEQPYHTVEQRKQCLRAGFVVKFSIRLMANKSAEHLPAKSAYREQSLREGTLQEGGSKISKRFLG